ncbi:MAG TPA: mechanosensitive ion channel domain-containing protein [Candidatus Sulfotelmatobacter sp.]|nr:mechanosensitive ion channel domain-containing protein [Candidatus Sulfotelmatobacter sp.]
MKTTKQAATITLIILLGLIAYGLFRTGRPITASQVAPGGESPQAVHGAVIDQSSLFDARRLVQMPTTADELPMAQEALRLGDREMDLAFAAGVRETEENPPALSAEAKQSEARLQKAEKALEADNARVEQLTSALSKATGVKANSLDDQLEQAKVQVQLDQDEVDNAKQELTIAGGDTQGRIEQLMKEHDDASHLADTTTVNTSTPPDRIGLVHRYQQWLDLHDKKLQLWQAKQDAESSALAFTAKRDALESNIKAKTQPDPGTLGGEPMQPAGKDSASSPHEASADLVSATKRRSATMKALTNFEERIEDQKNLAETYRKWLEVVSAQQRTVIHRGLSGVAVVLAILLIGIFFDSWLQRLLNKVRLDSRQAETLHAVISTGLQIIALGLVLLVIFGPPSQLGTILGLAGAGLTVALKDFIISFIGWFVLMGRNGIRLGDWVEINGVTGEVIELGMFHTVLLETGNWTDSGHPTGRRVTFTNSFAIEGHYFNFSTSGQWLWDELTLVLASSQNPYPIVEAIQKAVLEATAQSASQAEKEWQYAAHSRSMRALSAAPAINVKPVSGGVEIAVRYITRANERYQLRSKLYQAAMNLISKKDSPTPVSISEKQDPKPA